MRFETRVKDALLCEDKAEWADIGVHPGSDQHLLGFRVRTSSLDFADGVR